MFTAALRCVALAALVAACADGQTTSFGVEQQAVVGGTASGPGDDAVVRFVSRRPAPYSNFECAGVLLAPNVMLTALHCVAVFDGPAPFGCQADGTLDPRWSGGWIGETLDPATIEVTFGNEISNAVDARGVLVLGSGSTAACLDDIAFVLLDTDLPSRGLAVRTDRPVVEGELMTIVGFGQNGLSDVPRARRSGVPVVDVGPDDTSDGIGTAAPRTFVVGDGPCRGDDAAPALSDDTGAVTGVLAFVFGGDCEQTGTGAWFTKVAPFTTLLADAFEAAGGEPSKEASGARVPVAQRASGCALAPPSLGQSDAELAVLAALSVLLVRRRGWERSGAARRTARIGVALSGWRPEPRSRKADRQ
jgi:hypothetical protein